MDKKLMGSWPRLVSVLEAAEMLSVSVDQVHRWNRDGLLEAEYPEGRRGGKYFQTEDIQTLIEARASKTLSDHDVKILALQSLVSSKRAERKLDELLGMLGVSDVKLGTSREEVLAFFVEVEDEIKEGEPLLPEEAIGWAKRMLGITEEYLELVKEHTFMLEPWVPYMQLSKKLHDKFPAGQAGAYLSHAIRNLRHTAYFYVRRADGVREATKRFPEGGVTSQLLGIMFPKS